MRVVADGTATTVMSLSNANASAGYVRRTISLAPFAGKTIELRFTGVEDFALATSFYIDDVSIS